jgi:6-phosphogluconolactonase
MIPTRILFLIFTVALAHLSASATSAADQYLYLSAGGNVTAFKIDPSSGELTPLHSVELPGAGPTGVSTDRERLFVNAPIPTLAGKKGKPLPGIATLAIGEDGRLRLLAHTTSAMGAGYLSNDSSGKFLAGNSYGEGTAALWRLDETGVYRGAAPQVVTLEKNAHSAVFSPGNGFLLVPATGPNKVFQLHFDSGKGALEPNDPPHADGPQGENEARQPRHLVFHAQLPMAYTTNERERPGVGVWEWDEERGQLRTVQNLITYPEEFDGIITTADLHFTPDGRYLYVSNRDVTDRKARVGTDHIVGFRCDPKTGLLTYISHTPCEHVPRSFAVDDTGNFVYVAGQSDDRLGVYRIDGETGELSKVSSYEVGSRPSWVTCVTR